MIRWLFLVLLTAFPTASLAGAICGTVTDGATGAPIAEVGVLVHQNDAYSGFHAATDVDGHFCIELPSGIYRLEIRVDDYLTTWREDVLVDDGPTDVLVPLAVPAVMMGAPWPNPTSGSSKIRMTVNRRADIELSVYDARGRLLRRWAQSDIAPGDLDHVWDGLDHTGRRAVDGLYLIRARADGVSAVRTITLIR